VTGDHSNCDVSIISPSRIEQIPPHERLALVLHDHEVKIGRAHFTAKPNTENASPANEFIVCHSVRLVFALWTDDVHDGISVFLTVHHLNFAIEVQYFLSAILYLINTSFSVHKVFCITRIIDPKV